MALPVTDGLVLNLRAAAFTQADATTIASWPDSSGAGNNADILIGDNPAYYTSISGSGGPAVRFTNGALQFTNNAIFNSANSAEVFIAVRTDGTTDNSGLYQFGGNDWTYYPYTDGNVYDGSFTDSRYSFPAVTPSTWHIYSVSHDGSTRSTSIDGTVVHTVNTPFVRPGNATKNILRIGRSQGTPWHGDIGEIAAYSRALTPTERSQVLTYLTAQHITAATPSPVAANISRATATYLPGINPSTWTYPVSNLDNRGYTSSADDGTGRATAYRQAWWTFVPASNGSVGLQGQSSSNPAQNIEHRLYRYDGTTLTLIEAPTNSDSVTPVAVTAGTRYYLMIGTPTDTDALYGFGIFGPVPTPEPLKHLPAGMATATYVNSINPSTWTYFPSANTRLDNSTLTSSDYDGTNRGTAYRQAWWTFIPSVSGSAGLLPVSTSTGTSYPIEHRIYSYDGTTLTFLNVAISDPVSLSVNAGLRYYVMVGIMTDAPGGYGFGLYGPAPAADPGPPAATTSNLDVPAAQLAVRLPAASASNPATPTATTNHQWSNATVIHPAADGTWSGTLDNTGADYATTEVNPTTYGLGGYRSGWYTFTPGTSGQAVFSGTGTTACEIDLLSHGSTWELLGYSYGNATPLLYANVTQGVQYYLRVVSSGTDGQVITLHLTGITPADKSVTASPIRAALTLPTVRAPRPADRLLTPAAGLTVVVHGKIVGEVDTAAAPPVSAAVRLPATSVNDLAAPPVGVGLTLPPVTAASISLTLSAPDAGETVAIARPQFVVGLTADGDDTLTYTIEVQYADNEDFTGATTLSMPAPVVDGGEILTPTTDVPAHTWWRARLLLDGAEQLAWTDSQDFTVTADIVAATLPITWTVDTSAVRAPHLWHFDPPGGTTGDTVTVYGQGFGTTGTVLLGDTAMQVASWTRIAAAPENSDDTTRTIDGGDVTPEHYEIVVTVPALDGPGDALTVES